MFQSESYDEHDLDQLAETLYWVTESSKAFRGIPVTFSLPSSFFRSLLLLDPDVRSDLIDWSQGKFHAESAPVHLLERIECVPELSIQLMQHLKGHPEDLPKIPWDVFEHLVAEFFASWGYDDVRLVGRDSSTSADVFTLTKTHSGDGPLRYFIEVKQTRDTIGVNVIDGVLGAIVGERARHNWDLAMIISTAGFKDIKKYTPHELALLKIECRDLNCLLRWLADYSPSEKGLYLPKPLTKMPTQP